MVVAEPASTNAARTENPMVSVAYHGAHFIIIFIGMALAAIVAAVVRMRNR